MTNIEVTEGDGTLIIEGDALTGGNIIQNAEIAYSDSGTKRIAIVSSAGALKVDPSGVTQPVSGTITANNPTAANFNAQIVGSVAHDAVDSGNPIKVGGVARTTNPTAVASGDRVDSYMDKAGKQVVILDAPREMVQKNLTTITASTAETTILSALGAGNFADLAYLAITNTSATATRVDLRDTTGGTVRLSLQAPAGSTTFQPLPVPVPQTTANANWTATCITSLTDLRIFGIWIQNV